MSQKPKLPANVGTAVKRAIRHLGETKGSSFVGIKKYVLSIYQGSDTIPDSSSIKQYLRNAVDKGVLLKLDNGNYKVKEATRRKKSRSRSRSRGKSREKSNSKKRSGGKRRSRSGSRKRKRSSSGKTRKRTSSGKRKTTKRSKTAPKQPKQSKKPKQPNQPKQPNKPDPDQSEVISYFS